MNNSTRMWKILRSNEKLFLSKKHLIKCKRTFLSENYRCENEWNKRLETSLIKKVNPFDFYLQLDNQHNISGKIAAVDIDIFVNSLKNDGHIEDLLDMIYRLRMGPESSFTLPSTHCAVTRYLLDNDNADQVYDVLNDRLNYGIFPDHHTINLLMDTYIKKEDFTAAAKIATLLMIQEDSDSPIANALGLYSCHKYLDNPQNWSVPEEPKDESKEEVKVRVRFLRNPYFDDHFDLVQPTDLVGKTMAFFGKHRGGTLGRTCQLRGFILYKKYSKVVQLIDEWKDEKEIVFKEVFDLIKKDAPTLFEGELSEEMVTFKQKLEELEKMDLKAGSILEEIENYVKKTVQEKEESDIAKQCQSFTEWIKLREDVLEKHSKEMDKIRRIKNIETIKKELEDEERLLTFFEKEEEIELKIEAIDKKIDSMKINPKLLRKKLKNDEEYVPPDVLKRRIKIE